MRRFLLVAAAALALTACGESSSSLLAPDSPPRYALGDAWSLFPTQTPNETLTFASGWEVGTQFYSTVPVCVMGFRYWRAAGETGTNRVKLWTNSGTRLASVLMSGTGTGWQYANFAGLLTLPANTYYRVSVNTNTAQVKTFGAFLNGPITNGPLVATSGYYGQPTGVMPTTQSSSNFFVDLLVVEC